MLLVGRLLPLPMLIIFVPLALALCYFAMRQLPVSWPRFAAPRADTAQARAERAQTGRAEAERVGTAGADAAQADGADPAAVPQPRPGGKRRRDVRADVLLLTVAIAVGFAVWQVVYGSQQIIVVSDPGTYLQYGYWIAQHGAARIPQSATAFGSLSGLNFASLGFYQSGSVVSPAFMPGLPLVLAGGAWIGGVQGALLMPGRHRRLRGAVVRGAGRAARRTAVGARRGAYSRAHPARAVREPRAIQRTAGPGAAVRRAVPGGRLARGHPSAWRLRRGDDARRVRRARAWPDGPGQHRLAEHSAAGVPYPGPDVRRQAATGGPAGHRPAPRRDLRALRGHRARPALPVHAVRAAAPVRAVRRRVRRGDRAHSAAGLSRRACLAAPGAAGADARGRAARGDDGAAVAWRVPAVGGFRAARPAADRVRHAALPAGHPRADRPGRDQVRGRAAAAWAPAGGRPAPDTTSRA